MSSKKQLSRIAGLIYLMVVLTGIFSIMYVPFKLIVYEDASSTFQNISSSEFLFRMGIVSGNSMLFIFSFFTPSCISIIKSSS